MTDDMKPIIPWTPPEPAKKPTYAWHIPMERVHELAVERGRLGGRKSHGGGRKRSPQPRKPVAMQQSAFDTFRICAAFEGKSRVQFLTEYADSLRMDPRYAHLFPGGLPPQE